MPDNTKGGKPGDNSKRSRLPQEEYAPELGPTQHRSAARPVTPVPDDESAARPMQSVPGKDVRSTVAGGESDGEYRAYRPFDTHVLTATRVHHRPVKHGKSVAGYEADTRRDISRELKERERSMTWLHYFEERFDTIAMLHTLCTGIASWYNRLFPPTSKGQKGNEREPQGS